MQYSSNIHVYFRSLWTVVMVTVVAMSIVGCATQPVEEKKFSWSEEEEVGGAIPLWALRDVLADKKAGDMVEVDYLEVGKIIERYAAGTGEICYRVQFADYLPLHLVEPYVFEKYKKAETFSRFSIFCLGDGEKIAVANEVMVRPDLLYKGVRRHVAMDIEGDAPVIEAVQQESLIDEYEYDATVFKQPSIFEGSEVTTYSVVPQKKKVVVPQAEPQPFLTRGAGE